MLTILPILAALLAIDPPAGYDPRPILDAIRAQESGGHPDPANAVGDGGKALGPYQIHRSYWLDAVNFDKTLGGRYEDVRDQAYAERVILAYWRRYAPAWDAETLARTHNGGPKGATRNSTLQYWHDVRSRMR